MTENCFGWRELVQRMLGIAILVTAVDRASGQAYTTVRQNGPSTNRVDIVFVGDGYLAADLSTTYAQHVDSQVASMFQSGQDPFPRYNHFFNVHRVNVASNQRGADKPPQNIFVDTALDSSYWWDGTTERLLYLDANKANAAVNSALAGSGIDVDMRLATVNDSKYGGGGGQWAVFAGQNSSSQELALHELGHSFGSLADEYFTNGTTYTGGEPTAPNVTRASTTGKWDRWLGYNDPSSSIGAIGYYQGGQYYQNGIYRPSNNSKMRALGRPFDAVSREQFISRIYAEVDPLDGWLSNSVPLQNPPLVWVDTVDPTVIDVEWLVNGISQGNRGENLSIASLNLPLGNHVLTARAYDGILDDAFGNGPLDWYRLSNTATLQQQIQWQIQITVRTGDFDANNHFDCTDINALVQQVANGGTIASFDLSGDGLVTSADVSVWLSLAGAAELPSGHAFLPGDANLDGVVDGSDFGIWNSHKFTTNPAWCAGDFTTDGVIDGSDYGVWNGHKFQVSDSAGARAMVPEPALVMPVLLGILTLSQNRSWRSQKRVPSRR